MSTERTIIGRTSIASFPDDGIVRVPVKIDTGADSSAIWASSISIDDKGILHFKLFDEKSPFYTGNTLKKKNYMVRFVRSSNGHAQIRYSVQLSVILNERKIRGSFTLADRSKNTYPVLIGCRLLNGKFIVDVSKGVKRPEDLKVQSNALNKELKRNPKAFYEKYHMLNMSEGDAQ